MFKLTVGLIVIAGLVSVGCMLSVILLYAAGALGAARTTALVPIIGPLVSERIEQWTLGAHEDLTIDEMPPPLVDGNPPITPPPVPTVVVTPRADCKQPRGWPMSGEITQGFHPGHTGIDISNVTGTGVQATMCGTVIYAGWSQNRDGSPGYGNLVIVQNDTSQTYYAHLSAFYVAVGDSIDAGQLLAASGSTGNSTGPHLHYEVRIDGVPQDPWPYMQSGGDGIGRVINHARHK